jgi:signal transduction histidine kinase
MTTDEFLTYLSWSIYILLFVLTLVQAVRRPLRANIDIAILFSLPAGIIAIGLATRLGYIPAGGVAGAISASLLLAMGYMLLRLVHDFADVPRWLMRLSELALAVFVIGAFVFALAFPPQPPEFSLLEVIYLVGLLAYTTVRFVQESRHSGGVTKRRMRAVAIGSLCLWALLVVAGLLIFFPHLTPWTRPITEFLGIASGVSYFLGFATPSVLRRAWQEPELRAFLGRAAALPRLPDTESIVKELETGAATSVGAPNARIGLWDEEKRVLRFTREGQTSEVAPSMKMTMGKAFLLQKPAFTPKVAPDNPLYDVAVKQYHVQAVMAAPITAGQKRLGVLTAYAPRAPIFADEDLALLHLLADQAAVILESRALIDEAARVQAREEVARLKEDFLSAAAHDLKTPLTILVAQTELLERRAMRDPAAPADLESLQRLKREVHRLKTLVLELLDAARAEQGRLVGERELVDIAAIAREVCARHTSERHPCIVEASEPVVGIYDSTRIFQLIENLVENAVKYSPDGGTVHMKAWCENGWNRFSVMDVGIGIPAADLPNIFQRFHRGANVDDRQFTGMGLGLYICRGIVEEHGGRIWAESTPQSGDGYRVGGVGAEDGLDPLSTEYAEYPPQLVARNLSTYMGKEAMNGRSTGGATNDDIGQETKGDGSNKSGTTFHVALPAAQILPTNSDSAHDELGEREQARA